MVEGGGGETMFPVIFFDGEREINIGNVKIEPKQIYKSFQIMLAREIGISPNQISIYLVDRKSSKSAENRRKFPITAKANFSQICREKDCSVLVVLKRSRKTRSRKFVEEYDFSGAVKNFMPENAVLLRRDQIQYYDQNAYLNNPYLFPRMEEAFPMMMKKKAIQSYFCEECTIAKKNGKRADFHHCVNDVVVEEFRAATAGPIGPVRW